MYTILLVDDDQATLEANEQFFAENGYEVFCSATGRRAVEMIQTIKLDCVILDIDLPDEDGFDVCSRVRTFTSLPIIFLSNYTEEESRIRGLVIGGDDLCVQTLFPAGAGASGPGQNPPALRRPPCGNPSIRRPDHQHWGPHRFLQSQIRRIFPH